LPKVSVIVPNYNYVNYIESRINSILDQRVPFYELIVLDDASTDGSVAVIERLAAERGVHLRVVHNEANSGSVFKQWEKGVELARGDYIWIAEADDLAEPEFLSALLGDMLDPSIVMAYCESKQIDSSGTVLTESYRDYTRDVSTHRWMSSYRQPGHVEIEQHLAIKNTVPNVSAVVFRRSALRAAIARERHLIDSFRVAGDWIIYLATLEAGDIVYLDKALNLHRRHASSVTSGGDHSSHMLEILRVQKLVQQRYSVPGDVIRKAEEYAKILYGYFGLSPTQVAELTARLRDEVLH
jgi:glycosyltransferase involved in cell wall biosynthesis